MGSGERGESGEGNFGKKEKGKKEKGILKKKKVGTRGGGKLHEARICSGYQDISSPRTVDPKV